MGSMEELFEGQPTGLPAPMSWGSALYQEGSGRTAKVRQVGGYAPFIEFCTGHSVRAEDLASDIERLIWFLRAFAPEIESDSKLSTAAAAFTGNAIARLRPDAEWTAYEGGSRMVGNTHRQFETDRLLKGLRSADDESVRGLVSALSDWAQEEVDDAQAVRPVPVPPTAGQPRYVRPPLPAMTYYSPVGEPIPYGRQWDANGPAPDSYSVDSHPERFAGLHDVVLALVDHLAAVYDVDVDDDPVHAGELLMEARDVVQAVRITPRRDGAATLTFVLTVAAGGYSERYPVGSRRWREYALTAVDGSGSEGGRGEPGPVAAERLRDAEIRLRHVAGGWSPWPLRDSPGR
jgi:hypothetical protein